MIVEAQRTFVEYGEWVELEMVVKMSTQIL
jgi:hypothetical protein